MEEGGAIEQAVEYPEVLATRIYNVSLSGYSYG